MNTRAQPVIRPEPGRAVRGHRGLYRSKNGYYARMSVPHALRSIVGQQEFRESIDAGSDARAARKLHAVVAGFHARIDAAKAQAKAAKVQATPPRPGRSLSPQQLAAAHYNEQVAFDTELRNSDHRYSHGFVDMEYVESLKLVANGSTDNQASQEIVGGIARKYQSVGNLRATFGTPEWRASIRALAVAELESLARTAERDDGVDTGQPSHPLLTAKAEPVTARDPLAARIISDDSKKPLTEIVDDFIKERKPTDKGAKGYRLTVRLFEEILGEDKPVYSIVQTDVLNFKRALQELPSNRTKRFPGLTAPRQSKKIKRAKCHSSPSIPRRSITSI